MSNNFKTSCNNDVTAPYIQDKVQDLVVQLGRGENQVADKLIHEINVASEAPAMYLVACDVLGFFGSPTTGMWSALRNEVRETKPQPEPEVMHTHKDITALNNILNQKPVETEAVSLDVCFDFLKDNKDHQDGLAVSAFIDKKAHHMMVMHMMKTSANDREYEKALFDMKLLKGHLNVYNELNENSAGTCKEVKKHAHSLLGAEEMLKPYFTQHRKPVENPTARTGLLSRILG